MNRLALTILGTVALAGPASASLVNTINPLGRTLAQQTETGGAFISLEDFQTKIVAAGNLAKAGVFDAETTTSGNITANEPNYADADITITGMARYGRNDANAFNYSAFTSGGRFGFVQNTETWTLAAKAEGEVVTHFGAMFSQWRVNAVLTKVTATFSDGSTAEFGATVPGPTDNLSQQTTYLFVGIQAPPGLGIQTVKVDEVTGGDWVGFDDVSFIVGPPTSADPYGQWTGQHSLEGDDALPGSDPDHDGVSNLVEFLLGGNPRSGTSGVAPVFADREGDSLILVFNRNKPALAAGFTLTPQFSTSLAEGEWTDAEASMLSVIDDGDVEIVTVTIPVPQGGGDVFARLSASGPPAQ